MPSHPEASPVLHRHIARQTPLCPGAYHSGADCFSVADGHTETHRWLEPTTRVQLGQAEGVTHISATDRDVRWLHDHCTYLK